MGSVNKNKVYNLYSKYKLENLDTVKSVIEMIDGPILRKYRSSNIAEFPNKKYSVVELVNCEQCVKFRMLNDDIREISKVNNLVIVNRKNKVLKRIV